MVRFLRYIPYKGFTFLPGTQILFLISYILQDSILGLYIFGVITILVPRIDLNNPGTDVYNSGQAVFTKLGPRTHLLQFSYFRMYQDCKTLQKLQFSYFHKYHDCNYGSYTILLLLIYNYGTFTRIAVCLDVLTQGSPSVLMSSRKDPDDRRLS